MARTSGNGQLAVLSDDDLVDNARADGAALSELYRRHVGAAWGLAQAVTGNSDEAGDAVADAFTRLVGMLPQARPSDFRLYLMATTRNAAIDIRRRAARVQLTDDDGSLEPSPNGDGPADAVVAGEDATLVRQALAELPERWRSVLWLTEVERLPPREVAVILGTSANNVSQVAVRARSRMRQYYVQAQVRNHAAPECDYAVNHLGAYATSTLGRGDTAKVEQHLDACEACRDRLAELRDIGVPLRRAMIALPAGLRLAMGERLNSGRTFLESAKDLGGSSVSTPEWVASVARGLGRSSAAFSESPLVTSTSAHVVTSP
ncbi:MAG TPA: sigma-70 family RNA polymerase sigma factor, partial [Acidimicrobiales bacterium]